MLARRNDDTIFTSILGVFMVVGLHLITIIKLLDYLGIVSYPIFSTTYLYNKLYWYVPGGILLAIIYWYFGKSKTKGIVEKYSSKDNFYSIKNIIFFLLVYCNTSVDNYKNQVNIEPFTGSYILYQEAFCKLFVVGNDRKALNGFNDNIYLSSSSILDGGDFCPLLEDLKRSESADLFKKQ